MATVPLADVFNWPFIWTFMIGMAAVALPSILVAKFLFPNTFAGLTLHGLTAIFANTGYMGIPLFIAAFGPEGTLPAVIATAVNSAVIIGLSMRHPVAQAAATRGFHRFTQARLQMGATDFLLIVFYSHSVRVERTDDVDLPPRAGDACIDEVTLEQEEVLFE